MLSFEQGLSGTEISTPVEDVLVGDEDTEPTELTVPTSAAAARMLELAAVTADQLVTEAQTEAEALMSAARARADAILEACRSEADELAAALGEEKAALEAQLATLRQMESDHRSQMRHYLTEQLSSLDATRPESPTLFAG